MDLSRIRKFTYPSVDVEIVTEVREVRRGNFFKSKIVKVPVRKQVHISTFLRIKSKEDQKWYLMLVRRSFVFDPNAENHDVIIKEYLTNFYKTVYNCQFNTIVIPNMKQQELHGPPSDVFILDENQEEESERVKKLFSLY